MNQFTEKIINLSDKDLIIMTKIQAEDYTNEALTIANRELKKRKINENRIKEILHSVQKKEKQQKEKKDQNNSFIGLFKLKTSEEDIKKEIQNYKEKGYNPIAHAAAILMLIFAGITLIYAKLFLDTSVILILPDVFLF